MCVRAVCIIPINVLPRTRFTCGDPDRAAAGSKAEDGGDVCVAAAPELDDVITPDALVRRLLCVRWSPRTSTCCWEVDVETNARSIDSRISVLTECAMKLSRAAAKFNI